VPGRNLGPKSRTLFGCVIASLVSSALLTSCASDRNYRTIPPGEGPVAPRYVELREEPQIATYHFPRGLYTLEAADDAGYYYRAPRQLIKHSFAGFDQYEGGLFVRKDNRDKIRGYVVWAGGRTKIGNLSRADHQFRDPQPAAQEPPANFPNSDAPPEF
jgi:hypothetical protein